MDFAQQQFGAYKEKRRTRAQFLEVQKQYAIDTTQLVPRQIKSYVSIFAGLRGSKKIVIVDANNNHDFSDDTSFEFDTLTMERSYRGDTVELAPIIRVQYETIEKQQVKPTQTYLRVMPYDAAYGYPEDMPRRLSVYIQPMVYREALFEVASKRYKLNAANDRTGRIDDYTEPVVMIQLADVDYTATKERAIQIGKEIVVGDQLFTLLNSTRDGKITLVADRYDPNRVGGRVNNLVPALVGKTSDRTSFSVNQLLTQGSYVLLDFWGSWCGPCIASMPALKGLHSRVKADKVRFVGIDYEYDEAGQKKAYKLANDRQFNWVQVVEYSSQQTAASIPRRLDVVFYPTFILMSPDGRILVREAGEFGLRKVEERLAQLKLLDN